MKNKIYNCKDVTEETIKEVANDVFGCFSDHPVLAIVRMIKPHNAEVEMKKTEVSEDIVVSFYNDATVAFRRFKFEQQLGHTLMFAVSKDLEAYCLNDNIHFENALEMINTIGLHFGKIGFDY